MKRAGALLLLAMFFFVGRAGPLRAGLVIRAASETGGERADITLHLAADRLMADTAAGPHGDRFIFHAGERVLWLLNTAAAEVTEVTAADMDRLRRMLAEMEAQLAALPAEQRVFAEAMLRRAVPFFQLEQPVFAREAAGVEVGSWTADHYLGRVGEEKTAELWVAGWQQLGLAAADFAAYEALQEFLGRLGGLVPVLAAAGGATAGFPVRAVRYLDGRVGSRLEVTAIEKEVLEASLFEVPADYRRKSLGEQLRAPAF